MLVTGQSRVKAGLVVFSLVATILASMNGLQGPSRTAWDPTVGFLGAVTPGKGSSKLSLSL